MAEREFARIGDHLSNDCSRICKHQSLNATFGVRAALLVVPLVRLATIAVEVVVLSRTSPKSHSRDLLHTPA